MQNTPQPIFPQLSHPFPLPNPILFLGIPCALVKLMEGDLCMRKKIGVLQHATYAP